MGCECGKCANCALKAALEILVEGTVVLGEDVMQEPFISANDVDHSTCWVYWFSKDILHEIAPQAASLGVLSLNITQEQAIAIGTYVEIVLGQKQKLFIVIDRRMPFTHEYMHEIAQLDLVLRACELKGF